MLRFNPLLDSFPTTYEGYSIQTDFRVGILISMLFDNENVSEDEKKYGALLLLYGDNESIPTNIELAWNGVVWFMNLGFNKCINIDKTTNKNTNTEKTQNDIFNLVNDNDLVDDKIFDFDFDSSRVYTGFLRTYGVDLSVEKLHFFKFMFMLSDLENDTSYNKVIEIRQTSLSGKKGDELRKWNELKQKYNLPANKAKSDKKEREFLKSIGMSDENIAKVWKL